MDSFRPYVWLKKNGTLFTEFFCISLPSGFRVSGTGLQSPTDDTSKGIRTYKFNVEAHTGSAPSIIDSAVGTHSQPANISSILFKVIDVTDSGNPVKKGEATSIYQDGDESN